MNAIAVVPGTKTVRVVDRPEPSIAAPDEIKLRVVRVGICGTDREEAAGGRAKAPPAHDDLVLGHEMFGQVTDVGRAVTLVKPGDYAVFTVRRGCGQCRSCAMNRSDMCRTGLYAERGIWALDGYQAEYVVDHEQYIVRVAPELEAVGVLAEPFSVTEKAISEAVHLQLTRLPDSSTSLDWLSGKRCLVAGLGPIGLLAALSLRLRGGEVWGLDVVDVGTPRPKWLELIGGHYLDGRQITPDHPIDQTGTFDLIVDATGIASLEFDLLDALAMNGVYAVTGIPSGDRPLTLSGADFMRRLVLRNQVMVGSVNASRDHFQLAVNDLVLAQTALASTGRGPHYAPASLCGLRIGVSASRLRRNQGRPGVGRGSMTSDVRISADVNELSRRAAEAAVTDDQRRRAKPWQMLACTIGRKHAAHALRFARVGISRSHSLDIRPHVLWGRALRPARRSRQQLPDGEGNIVGSRPVSSREHPSHADALPVTGRCCPRL